MIFDGETFGGAGVDDVKISLGPHRSVVTSTLLRQGKEYLGAYWTPTSSLTGRPKWTPFDTPLHRSVYFMANGFGDHVIVSEADERKETSSATNRGRRSNPRSLPPKDRNPRASALASDAVYYFRGKRLYRAPFSGGGEQELELPTTPATINASPALPGLSSCSPRTASIRASSPIAPAIRIRIRCPLKASSRPTISALEQQVALAEGPIRVFYGKDNAASTARARFAFLWARARSRAPMSSNGSRPAGSSRPAPCRAPSIRAPTTPERREPRVPAIRSSVAATSTSRGLGRPRRQRP